MPNERSNVEVQLNQLDEPIEIEAYNPALETVFLSAAKALRTRLGALALGIEHIGSTAVPGLRGKPVVDIMLLRDYLRTHPDEAERYGRMKDRIIEGGARTLLAYSGAKHETIQDLLANARAWKYEHNLSNHT